MSGSCTFGIATPDDIATTWVDLGERARPPADASARYREHIAQ
jgi:hypothetical protein